MNSNHLQAALEEGRFVLSAELVLGRDHTVGEAEEFVAEAAKHDGGIRIVSLTDLPGGNPALPPEAFVERALAAGLTPIAHLTGKDANRSLIEGRLHALARLGAANVLALTGDAQRDAFSGKSKPVHDLDSALILWLIAAMRKGLKYTLGTRTVETTPFDFFPGAVVNPFKLHEPDLMMQLYKLELKIGLGARFLITQIGFNLRKLDELRHYMLREGLAHAAVIANVYVPTATIARMMQSGDLAGCVVTDELVRRLEQEKKPERLERAALMVAAVKGLGFAGAHIGGFGLSYRDFLGIRDRAEVIGNDWRRRMDELIFASPNEFYLLPRGADGLSDADAAYRLETSRPRVALKQRLSRFVHRYLIADGSPGARFFGRRLKPDAAGQWRHSALCLLLGPSSLYRKATLGCASCGDCIQEHLNYVGCSMRWCYKELRNGPCGGSRVDGTCEARPELPCIWNRIYLGTRALGDDPRKFARTLIPPRDWTLDRTNALANRMAGIDNLTHRIKLPPAAGGQENSCSS